MQLITTVKEYDELMAEEVTSYEMETSAGEFYNIEKHETDYNGSIYIFETTENKNQKSKFEELKKALDGLEEEATEEQDKSNGLYYYIFTTYNSSATLEEIFKICVDTLENIKE